MNRHTFAAMALSLVALVLPAGLTHGQAPPSPTIAYQFRTPSVSQPASFDLVHNLTAFEPGAATPFHQHPGQVVVTVLEGENVLTVNGKETVYGVGESFVELPGEVVQARNAGTTPMVVMPTYLIPVGGQLSHPEPNDATPPPRPTINYQFKTTVPSVADPFDVVQLVQDFVPGAATPYHTHPGIGIVTVISGTLTFSVGGVDHQYTEGDSFVEEANKLAQARNTGTTPTRVMASFLLPQGAPVFNVQPAAPAALPNTGAHPVTSAQVWLLVIVAGLICGAWLLRRNADRGARKG